MKFFLLFILSFAAIFGFTAAQQNCTTIQWDPNNRQLVTILNTGLQDAVAEAIQEEQIADCAWSLTKVLDGETCKLTGATTYNFDVLADNSCQQPQILFSLFINVVSGDIELFGSHFFPIQTS